jgi:hypothetical protein
MYTTVARKHKNAHQQKIWVEMTIFSYVSGICNYGLVCVSLSSVELWERLHNSFTIGSVNTLAYKAVLALKIIIIHE